MLIKYLCRPAGTKKCVIFYQSDIWCNLKIRKKISMKISKKSIDKKSKVANTNNMYMRVRARESCWREKNENNFNCIGIFVLPRSPICRYKDIFPVYFIFSYFVCPIHTISDGKVRII